MEAYTREPFSVCVKCSMSNASHTKAPNTTLHTSQIRAISPLAVQHMLPKYGCIKEPSCQVLPNHEDKIILNTKPNQKELD